RRRPSRPRTPPPAPMTGRSEATRGPAARTTRPPRTGTPRRPAAPAAAPRHPWTDPRPVRAGVAERREPGRPRGTEPGMSALFARLLDDAALFPPQHAPMDEALSDRKSVV